jgi:hypothetical protein
MKYDKAMTKTDKPNWDKAVVDEHDCMTNHTAWKAIDRNDVPEGIKIIRSTWAMKKKASGTYGARLNT